MHRILLLLVFFFLYKDGGKSMLIADSVLLLGHVHINASGTRAMRTSFSYLDRLVSPEIRSTSPSLTLSPLFKKFTRMKFIQAGKPMSAQHIQF